MTLTKETIDCLRVRISKQRRLLPKEWPLTASAIGVTLAELTDLLDAAEAGLRLERVHARSLLLFPMPKGTMSCRWCSAQWAIGGDEWHDMTCPWHEEASSE